MVNDIDLDLLRNHKPELKKFFVFMFICVLTGLFFTLLSGLWAMIDGTYETRLGRIRLWYLRFMSKLLDLELDNGTI